MSRSRSLAGASRRLFFAAAGTLVVLPAAADAQMHGDMPALAAARQPYESVRDYVLQTARGVPETVIAYQPTDEVRTFGQLLGHIGNASYAFCSAALGEQSPAQGNLEEVTTQAGLVDGLEDAFAYCDRAYEELAGPRLMEEVDLFGMSGTRLWVLVFNATHTWEHYGNLVTYMRLNDIVPPSSGGMSGN